MKTSDSLVDSVLGFGVEVSGSIPSLCKNFVFCDTLIGFVLNKESAPTELPSLCGTRVQTEGPLMTRPGKH